VLPLRNPLDFAGRRASRSQNLASYKWLFCEVEVEKTRFLKPVPALPQCEFRILLTVMTDSARPWDRIGDPEIPREPSYLSGNNVFDGSLQHPRGSGCVKLTDFRRKRRSESGTIISLEAANLNPRT
jgi:hypothetical protein